MVSVHDRQPINISYNYYTPFAFVLKPPSLSGNGGERQGCGFLVPGGENHNAVVQTLRSQRQEANCHHLGTRPEDPLAADRKGHSDIRRLPALRLAVAGPARLVAPCECTWLSDRSTDKGLPRAWPQASDRATQTHLTLCLAPFDA